MKAIVNKNRIMGMICLIIIAGFMISPVTYAANDDNIDANAGAQTAKELKLTQSYPEDGDNKLQVENTGIKLYFDGNVIDESVWKNNAEKFTLTSKKDSKKIKIRAYHYPETESETDYILVVVQTGQKLKPNTDYVFTIGKGVQSKDGKILSKDIVLNYKTVDVQGNSRVNMGLMALMVVGMIVMTVVSNKRKERKETEKKEEKVNPYKVAKEKGKSVEEVMEKIEKDKARKAKKLKGKGGDSDDTEEDDDANVYNVKKIRRVSDAGSTFKSGKKAEAEKKAKEAAANKAKGTTNPKKNKKKGKKKK